MDLSVRAYAINVDLNIASKKLVEFFSLYKNFSNFPLKHISSREVISPQNR